MTKEQKLYTGSICTFHPIRYGVSKTGKPIYALQSFDPLLPKNLRIVYGGKSKGKIILVFQWNNGCDRAILYHVLGVASPEILPLTLQYHYQIQRKEYKSVNLPLQKNTWESTLQRKNLTHLPLFSVDPLGCSDIDDAFSLEISDSQIKVGIHIAQPIIWLTLDQIKERAQVAFSTFYGKNGQILQPLWSPDIQHQSSLLKGQERAAYSIFFVFEKNCSLEKVQTFSMPSIVKNHCATHYDDLEYVPLQSLLSYTRILWNQPEMDTHEMVAQWMMEANSFVGKNFPGCPFRVQKDSNYPTLPSHVQTQTQMEKIFDHYTMEKATYSLEDKFHSSLQIENYVHFTSPIRRMMDCLVHWYITYSPSFSKEDWSLERMNELDQQTKRFHRDMKLWENLETMLKEKEGIVQTGFLYEKITPGTWRVYFEGIGFLRVTVVDVKMEHLIIQEKLDSYERGNSCHFRIFRLQEGFLPRQKIMVVPEFSLLEEAVKK